MYFTDPTTLSPICTDVTVVVQITPEFDRNRHCDMKNKDWASFLAGWDEEEDEGNFFGETGPPPYPLGLPNWFDKRTVDHGEVVQHRATHRFNAIKTEVFYEDGYCDVHISLDRGSYRDGLVVVDGIEYENAAHYGRDEGQTRVPRKSDPLSTTTTTSRHYPVEVESDRNKKRGESQEQRDNHGVPNDLHPYLVGDFLIIETDYEWPSLPKFKSYDPGTQQELFDTDFFGEANNGSSSKVRTNKRQRSSRVDPLAGFIRGFDDD